ncbi:uncharacterized protein LOC112466737 [Temnothorax curvispinosus]|uniref:Uncharacterized protein LOC112466737 n=1 Tax=Temnothorax curvispinosus TaxID=300111 RepID=A0A6J1R7Y9_9HYME|nr:uncharacterized protein LOC112466737 [Temnothorax curvispinosus]
MKNMKASYNKALEWRNKTGQGILQENVETGSDTVKMELIKRCKFFFELDEILGDKPHINPPYIHHSDDIELDGDGTSLEIETDTNDDTTVDTLLNTLPNLPDDIDASSFQIIEHVVETPTTSTSEDEPLKKRLRKSPIKSAAAALENSLKARIVVEEKRLNWEKAKEVQMHAEQQTRFQIEQEFKQQQLKFEREKWTANIERQKKSEDRQFELEKLKIEKDAELQKLKLQHDLELEKLKMGIK